MASPAPLDSEGGPTLEPFMLGYIPAVVCFVSIIGLMLYVGARDPEHPAAGRNTGGRAAGGAQHHVARK